MDTATEGVTAVTETMSTDTGGEENYLVVGLAVGIPCGVVILALVFAIIFIIILLLRPSSNYEEVEATYMRRRFQGLSLEDQRKMAANQKKKRKSERITRRHSSSTEGSAKSSVKLSPYSKAAKVRQDNPFGLQEWQLQMSGIDASPTSNKTDFMDEDSPYRRSPIGALNPLMLEEQEATADYEPAHKSSSAHQLPGDDGISSSSSDSMNPYD